MVNCWKIKYKLVQLSVNAKYCQLIIANQAQKVQSFRNYKIMFITNNNELGKRPSKILTVQWIVNCSRTEIINAIFHARFVAAATCCFGHRIIFHFYYKAEYNH